MPDNRRGHDPSGRRYPRTLRVNEVLREVLAEALSEIDDDRLKLATITGVVADPDVRHATVLLASLSDEAREALEELRPRLQAAIGREVRMKRTPRLTFEVDPAVVSGQRIDQILRGLDDPD